MFYLQNSPQKSKSVLLEEYIFFGLFRKGKTYIIAKFYRTDLVICRHFREEKNLSYSYTILENNYTIFIFTTLLWLSIERTKKLLLYEQTEEQIL